MLLPEEDYTFDKTRQDKLLAQGANKIVELQTMKTLIRQILSSGLFALTYLSKQLGFQYNELLSNMSHVAKKPVFGVSDQVRHERAVQPQKMARCLKVRI